MSEERGLIGSLFDLSFTDFVTTRIIKFLFILAIIFSGIQALAVIIAGFTSGSTAAGSWHCCCHLWSSSWGS